VSGLRKQASTPTTPLRGPSKRRGIALFRAVIVLPILLALGGCYISSVPLITPSQAVFPYQTITYTVSGEAPAMLVRQGNAYVPTDDKDKTTEMLFFPVSGPYYVVQVHDKSEAKNGYLYGFLKVDLAAKTASAYATMADAKDIGPGLPGCSSEPSDGVCLTKLQPYIDHALALAATAQPDAVYTLDFK
jgi:hypothetical protein